MKTTKVLYLINGLPRGGAEMGLASLIEGGLFAGCELLVATLTGGDPDLEQRFALAGAPPRRFSSARKMKPHHLLVGAARLAALILSWRPDVLVLSLPQANLLGRVIGRALGVPVIVAFEHNSSLARPLYTRGYRATAGCVDVVFADAAATLEIALKAHYPRAPDRLRVVPLISLPAPPPVGPPPQAPHFVAVGRLTTVKNHAAAIEAIGLLREEGLNAQLTVFGEGPERPQLERLIAERGLTAAVHLAGLRERWWEAGQFTGFVLTSRWEGLSLATVEAMWAGLPCIAPIIGGIQDYAHASSIYPLEDVEPRTVAASLRRVIEDPNAAQAKSAEARTRVLAMFGAESVRARIAALNAEFRTGFGSLDHRASAALDHHPA